MTSLDAVAEALPGEDGEPVPARIVVMSDGETTSGISNEEAAERGGLAGVLVDTIAFGTPEGTIEDAGDGSTIPVPVAPEPLADLAAGTGAQPTRPGPGRAERRLRRHPAVAGSEDVERDVSAWFVGAGIGLLALAGSLSLLWSQRLP